MANWNDLKASVAEVIKTNGNQEITGQILQNVLNNIISNVGENATFAGIATPSTNPGVPDGNVFYFATQLGTYNNFGGIIIETNGFNILYNIGANWQLVTIFSLKNGLGLDDNSVISQKAVTTISGINNLYSEFSIYQDYYPGMIVLFNGLLYKFTVTHVQGDWNDEDVIPFDLIQLLQENTIRRNGYLETRNGNLILHSAHNFTLIYTIENCTENDIFFYEGRSGRLMPFCIYFDGDKPIGQAIFNTSTFEESRGIIKPMKGCNKILFQSASTYDEKKLEFQKDLFSLCKINADSKYKDGFSYTGYWSKEGIVIRDTNIKSSVTFEKVIPGDCFYYKGNNGYNAAGILFYNDNMEVVGSLLGNILDSCWSYLFEIPNNVSFVQFQSSIDVNLPKKFDYKKLPNIPIGDISNYYEEHDGYLDSEMAFKSKAYMKCILSPFISCKEGDIFYYRGYGAFNGYACFMFDDDLSVVEKIQVADNTTLTKITITSGVKYVLFQSTTEKENELIYYLYRGDTAQIGKIIKVGNDTNILFGKKINWLGDSYVANHNHSYAYTWEYQIAIRNSMVYRNYGINGNGIVSGNNPMSERYVNMDKDADYVMVVGGTNDFNYQTPIETFKSLLESFLRNLVTTYVNSKIAVFNMFNGGGIETPAYSEEKTINMSEYANAMKEVCAKLSIPFCDLYNDSGIFAWSQEFRNLYFQSSNDYAHLNQNGHKRLLLFCEEFLLRL